MVFDEKKNPIIQLEHVSEISQNSKIVKKLKKNHVKLTQNHVSLAENAIKNIHETSDFFHEEHLKCVPLLPESQLKIPLKQKKSSYIKKESSSIFKTPLIETLQEEIPSKKLSRSKSSKKNTPDKVKKRSKIFHNPTHHTDTESQHLNINKTGPYLVIVESPAKARTLSHYLGSDYCVLASYGHVRDLASKKDTVNPDQNFSCIWARTPQAAKSLPPILDAAKQARGIILATDPDREGEAIAWHLLEVLKEEGIVQENEDSIQRVTFHSVTRQAILEAFKTPRKLDEDLINAYRARLILDYLVGFTLSPLLWRKLPKCPSAGRVQSVALKAIVEREEAIQKFVVEPYFSLTGHFQAKNIEFQGQAIEWKGKKISRLFSQEEANTLHQALIPVTHGVVEHVERKEVQQHPQAPFRTSTLQQVAARMFGFSPLKTMSLAQSLYEGVLFKGETVGLITYMRTDSVTFSDEALHTCCDLIRLLYGPTYCLPIPRKYTTKVRNAQEAHEAIRPTLFYEPSVLRFVLDDDQWRLYDLIWRRSLASQMSSAKFLNTRVHITPQVPVLHHPISESDKHDMHPILREETRTCSKETFNLFHTSNSINLNKISNDHHQQQRCMQYIDNNHYQQNDKNILSLFFQTNDFFLKKQVIFQHHLMSSQDILNKKNFSSDTQFLLLNQKSQDNTSSMVPQKDNMQLSTIKFRVTGRIQLFDGFLHVWEGENEEESEDQFNLPLLEVGDIVDWKSTILNAHETQPPPRFNEASLIKHIEESGIGRPSTYARIVTLLHERSYILNKSKKLKSLWMGKIVTFFLRKFFSEYVQEAFTAKMEEELDDISSGKKAWVDFLHTFWNPFYDLIQNMMRMPALNIVEEIFNDLKIFLFHTSQENLETIISDNPKNDTQSTLLCPLCLKGFQTLRVGRYGPFLSCTHYPECQFIKALSDEEDVPQGNALLNTSPEGIMLGLDPNTQNPIHIKNGRYGLYAQWNDEQSSKKIIRLSIPKGILLENITFDFIQVLKKFPIILKKEEKVFKIGIGSIKGPYIYDKKKYHHLGLNQDSWDQAASMNVDEVIHWLDNSKKNIKNEKKR